MHHELRVLQGLIFAVADKEIDQDYIPAVFCGDSSSIGYALKVTASAPEEVRRAARYRERWRFDLDCGPLEAGERSHPVVGSALLASDGEPADSWAAALVQRLRAPDLAAPKWCRPGREVPRVGRVPVLGPEWAEPSRAGGASSSRAAGSSRSRCTCRRLALNLDSAGQGAAPALTTAS